MTFNFSCKFRCVRHSSRISPAISSVLRLFTCCYRVLMMCVFVSGGRVGQPPASPGASARVRRPRVRHGAAQPPVGGALLRHRSASVHRPSDGAERVLLPIRAPGLPEASRLQPAAVHVQHSLHPRRHRRLPPGHRRRPGSLLQPHCKYTFWRNSKQSRKKLD